MAAKQPKPLKPIKKAPHLARCFEAGEVTALFALLHNWSKDDLLALLKEIEDFAKEAENNIEHYWRDHAFKPEVFMSPHTSKALDRQRKEAEFYVMETCVEISSVAQFYLSQNYGIDVCPTL